MSKPVIVTIPHDLGKAEAISRLQAGFTQARQQFSGQIAAVEDRWTGDRMDFRIGVLGQTLTGHIDVTDDSVRLEMLLPWVLAMVAEKARGFIRKQGTLMLEKK